MMALCISTRTSSLLLVLFVVLVNRVSSYHEYQTKIPNGNKVQHPCLVNHIWRGVGHMKVAGTGRRNPFGMDFAANGMKWTPDLCNKDSDGDGRTNGQELGDPDCIWVNGTAKETHSVTHPGICEPLDSEICSGKDQSWVSCEEETFKCDAVNETDVLSTTFRFPHTNIPAEPTTYICMVYDFDDQADYHLIATQPAINNSRVMHHIAAVGCKDSVNTTTEPFQCFTGVQNCEVALGIWTVGMPGECHSQQAGFLLGRSGYKKIMIQFHWTNVFLEEGLTDSTGFTLYYTPNLRPNNMSSFTVGQVYLEIPPHRSREEAEAVCRSSDTARLLSGPIHVTYALNHMHYLGIAQSMQLVPKNRDPVYITNEEFYSYDNPSPVSFGEGKMTVNPGDEIKTVCTFETITEGKTTYQGWGTLEEMCFGFIYFYPAENIPFTSSCLSFKSQSLSDINPKFNPTMMIGNCNISFFSSEGFAKAMEIESRLSAKCPGNFKCPEECEQEISKLEREDACFAEGEVRDMIEFLMDSPYNPVGQRLVSNLHQCDGKRLRQLKQDCSPDDINAGRLPSSVLLTLVIASFIQMLLSM